MTKTAVIGLGTMAPGNARTGMSLAYDPFEQAREKAPAGLALAITILTDLVAVRKALES